MRNKKGSVFTILVGFVFLTRIDVFDAKRLNIRRETSSVESKRTLELLHIPKTGGTALEKAALNSGINWGICHYKVSSEVGCQNPDFTGSREKNLEVTRLRPHERWHTPLQYFESNPLQDADTFAVIRNPYDRYISEYYCKWGSRGGPKKNKNDPDVMNRYLQQRIPEEFKAAHWIPQHYFIYDENGQRLVDHILHFENLHEEFAALMKAYDMDVVLPIPEKKNHASNDKRLTAKDLYPETLEIINRVAAKDFVIGQYKMVTDMNAK